MFAESVRDYCSLLVIVAVAFTALPASAAAAPNAGFFGIHAERAYGDEAQRGETLSAIAGTGVRELRQSFSWRDVELEPGVYDFGYLDRYVRDVSLAGLTLLPILFDPPEFRSSAPQTGARRGIYPPQDFREFGRFARAVVTRYGPGGTFWRTHPEIPRRPIRAWQVWNEPTLRFFWPSGPQPRAYGRMLRVVARAIRRADPGARVLTAALPDSRHGAPLFRYLDGMRRAKALRAADELAINPYASTPDDMMRLLGRVRRWLARHGRPQFPIHVSEFGWAGYRESEAGLPADTQARYVERAMDQLARTSRKLRLSAAYLYSWQDASVSEPMGDFWGVHTGLLYEDGVKKPAYEAFLRGLL